jgi:uncharacterized protein (DUF362 family)
MSQVFSCLCTVIIRWLCFSRILSEAASPIDAAPSATLRSIHLAGPRRAFARLLICGILSSPIWCHGESPQSSPDSGLPQNLPEPAENQPAEATPTPVPLRSMVYRAERSDAIEDYKTNPEIVRHMVDQLVLAVTRQATVASGWASLVKSTDVVGIKVCASGAPLFSTHPAVVDAIRAGLIEAGVRSQNIVVWDREQKLLELAGFRAGSTGYRLMWSQKNYDLKAFVTSPISGKLIYGDMLFVGKPPDILRQERPRPEKDKKKRFVADNLSDQSYVSNVLTHVVTKVINVPVLSDHLLCGLSGALFNMTVQNLDNWRRLVQSPVNGDPSIPEAYADPRIGEKVVLNIMDGLIALYAGAPVGDANYAIHHGTLYASKDPVALDAIALKMIDQWRIKAQMEPASKTAKYLKTAFTYGLGNADLSKIELVDLR